MNQDYNNNFSNNRIDDKKEHDGYDRYYNEYPSYYGNSYNYNQNQNQNPNPNLNQNNYYRGNSTFSSAPPKQKLRYGKVFAPFIIILLIGLISFIVYKIINDNKMNRTIMIYMVGSDLESKSSQGTYSISDIVGKNIDLENNNIILMVGGAKEWHNFVDSSEIGIYQLKSEGFEKVKTNSLTSMGDYTTLKEFLDYSYKEYPAKNYDLIFWNHGLGAMGIEKDEIANDYLSLTDLDMAFKNSKFEDRKLELTIFYNCLASNYHIANIMKNYSEYMVASEEIFYLSKVLNRLNFLEKLEINDTAYDMGHDFIEQSDLVIKNYNDKHYAKLDSTLSILDLSKMEDLNKKLNNFIEKINVKNDYYSISNVRRKLFTYGKAQTSDFDVVDLYELVKSLGTTLKIDNKELLDEINNLVLYTSNLNNHSNGISIYFPYYGSKKSMQTHLTLFKDLWNDSYYNFINSYFNIKSGTINSNRANGEANILENDIILDNDNITLLLTDKEKEQYANANIYLFQKENDKYSLLLESEDVDLVGNQLVFNNNKLLNVNNSIISYYIDGKVFGKISDDDELNTIFYVDDNGINRTILNSDDSISPGLLDYEDFNNIYFSKVLYDLEDNDEFNEYYKDSKTIEYIKIDKDNMNIKLDENNLNEYYCLIEMQDINNDIYYSKLIKIDK